MLELDSSMVFMYHSFFVSLAPLVPISPLIMLIAYGHFNCFRDQGCVMIRYEACLGFLRVPSGSPFAGHV